MSKFLDKAKQRFKQAFDLPRRSSDANDVVAAASQMSADTPGAFPNEHDLYRYRKQHGVNLGSWFVLERWIADSPFRNAVTPAQSDLDVAKGPDAQEILEHHWDSWITDADWRWLAERGINTVRIPIGYYHICGADPSVLAGTDFVDLDHVFAGAWTRIGNILATAYQYGIGVLFDLHAAPGKQNADAHSGTCSEPTFFKKHENMARTIYILTTLVAHLTSFARSHDPPLPNLVGIELLNEPQPGSENETFKTWYREAFSVIRAIDPNLPLYISDSWQTDDYAGFIKASGTPFIALDHHLYRCFTEDDIATPAAEHARRLRNGDDNTPQMFARVAGQLEGAGGALVVGEWSAALNPGSLHGASDERQEKRHFVEAQLQLYEQHCAGWFFWTYKKEHPGDTGWSFREAVDAGVFPSEFRRRVARSSLHDEESDVRRDLEREKALNEHSGYWAQYPGDYEHWRFADGFTKGWDDAYAGPWTKRRTHEHTVEKGHTSVWEFEHGFAQGLRAGTADLSAMA
ncbi:glycoside hydrolase [Trametes maxima]|nr:glycoside hydrolase [Trametes maxima]